MRSVNFNPGITPLFLVLMLLSSLGLQAQFTSSLEGTVTDPSGGLLPGATVTVTNLSTGEVRSLQTSARGYYRVTLLPSAEFDVLVAAPGFQATIQNNIRIQVAETRTLNVQLVLGSETVQITVTGQAPPLEKSEARISGLFEERKVADLPLIGRNYVSLVVLTPGVTGLTSGGGQAYAQATGDIFTTENGLSLNANGLGPAGNNYMVDSATTNNVNNGGVTNFTPNADSVQEIRVLTNNFSAEYGRNSSLAVNAITRGGTNEIHGTASWFHTNNTISSRNIFQTAVPVFRRNEVAWSLGGPVKKDSTFLFGTMDGLRSGVGTGAPTNVVTPEFIDFMRSNHPNNISTKVWTSYPAAITPTTNFQLAGGQVGVDCAGLPSPSDPIMTPVGGIPCNFPVAGEGNFQTTVPRDGFQWNTRVDQLFNGQKDRLYFNIYRTTLDTVLFNAPNVYPDFQQPWAQWSMYMNINETHVFSPTVVNEFGASYVRATGTANCDPCEVPGLNVTGIAGFGVGFAPGGFVQNIYEWRDVLSFTTGSHSMKIGGKAQHNQDYNDFGQIATRPQYSFFSIFDFANDNPFQQTSIGIDPRTAEPVQSAAGYVASRDGNWSLFFQDDWKVRPNLSLNLGIRYENYGNPYQRHKSTTNILFRGGNDFPSRVTDLKVDLTPNDRFFENSDNNNFAPRFGFAWDPLPSGNLVVRGGVGAYYDRLSSGYFAQNTKTNPPLVASVTASIFNPEVLPVYALGTSGTEPFGFPIPDGIQPGLDEKNGLLLGKANIAGLDRNMKTQYTFNWFFGLQYAIGGSGWVVDAAYLGSVAHKIYGRFQINRFAGDLIQNNGILTRLNSSFGGIDYGMQGGNSHYTGGTLSLKRRYNSGFSVDAAYTVGKVIDNFELSGGGLSSTVDVADLYNFARERGRASFDIRNRLALSLLWEIPGPQSGPGFLRGLLGGWQVSNITILQTGNPFRVLCRQSFIPVRDDSGTIVGNNGCDYNADGFNFDYPNTPSFGNSLSGLERSDYITGIFSASDFPAPPLGTPGDLGRNTFVGPGFANTDLSFIKSSEIPWFAGEGARLQFRVELYNAFNRVNLSAPIGELSNPLFGRSTSTFGPRNIQFGLRLVF
jgi:hypothetical protein